MRIEFHILLVLVVALALLTRCNAQSLIPAANCSSNPMTDLEGFLDFDGFSCDDYAIDSTLNCGDYGNYPGLEPEFANVTANEACLTCGACEVCTDLVNDWMDQKNKSCNDYNNDTLWDEYAYDFRFDDDRYTYYSANITFCLWAEIGNFDEDNVTAGEACCACGGGLRTAATPFPTTSPTTMSPTVSAAPSLLPSTSPSSVPSSRPSSSPSSAPSSDPTVAPTPKVIATNSPTQRRGRPKWRKRRGKSRKKRKRSKASEKKSGKSGKAISILFGRKSKRKVGKSG